MAMFKKLMSKIKDSIVDRFGKVSHTKISSYIILCSIVLTSLIFLIIDIANAITMWKSGEVYSIPASHITIFGMILTHHLFLLGIKKDSENKAYKCDAEIKISENKMKVEE